MKNIVRQHEKVSIISEMNLFEIIFYSLCQVMKSYQNRREYAVNATLLISLMQFVNIVTVLIPIKRFFPPPKLYLEKEHVIVISIVAAIIFYAINRSHLLLRKDLIFEKYHNLSRIQKTKWKLISVAYAILSPILMTLSGTYFDN